MPGYSEDWNVLDDRYCIRCKYNLRGQSLTANCPECGKPVLGVIVGTLCRYDTRGFVRSVHAGSRGILNCLLGTLLLSVLSIAVVWIDESSRLISVKMYDAYWLVASLAYLVLYGAIALSIFRLTASASHLGFSKLRLRITSRAAAVVSFVLVIYSVYGLGMGFVAFYAHGDLLYSSLTLGALFLSLSVLMVARYLRAIAFLLCELKILSTLWKLQVATVVSIFSLALGFSAHHVDMFMTEYMWNAYTFWFYQSLTFVGALGALGTFFASLAMIVLVVRGTLTLSRATRFRSPVAIGSR